MMRTMASSTHTAFASATIPAAAPDDVLALLTAPDAIATWAPVPFDVEEMDGRRLRPGTRARVSGGLAGRRVAFDVDVHRADDGYLALTAEGPVGLDVEYVVTPVIGGSEVRASVSVRRGEGLLGRVLAQATGALLSGGALELALGRITRELAGEPELLAA
jgi:uncharacterized protein YndB with AHSA1/START domain